MGFSKAKTNVNQLNEFVSWDAYSSQSVLNKLKETISVKDYGAVGDGVTDDTSAIQTAFTAAGLIGALVIFPVTNAGYLTTNTVTVPATALGIDMQGAQIWYNGTRDKPALICGTYGTGASRRRYLNMSVISIGFTGAAAVTWPAAIGTVSTDLLGKDGRYVGIRVVNSNGSKISTLYIGGFNKGLSMYADFNGCAYNNIDLGYHENNFIGVCLESAGTSNGFVNENKFFGGSMEQRSTTNSLGAAYGVVLTWDHVASYRGQNNNIFYSPAFELGSTITNRIPVYFDGVGSYNKFIECRHESNNGPFAYLDGKSTGTLPTTGACYGNIFTMSYDDSVAATVKGIVEVNDATSNIYESAFTEQRYKESWNSGRIPDLICANGANSVSIAGILAFVITAGTVSKTLTSASIKQHLNYLALPNGTAVGVQLKTSKIKRWIARSASLPGFGGRMFVQCIDAAGNVLTSAGANHPYVTMRGTLAYTTNYGGAYQTTSDFINGGSNTFLTFGADVDGVRIYFGGGTNNIMLQSMSVIPLMDMEIQSGGVGVSATAAEVVHSPVALSTPSLVKYSSAKPDTAGEHGAYNRGEMVLNSAAAVGAPAYWSAITNTIGYLNKAWIASTSYQILGEIVINGSNAYYVATAGTSASSGGPTGTGTGITDGTVVWNYLGPKAVFGTGPNLT